MQMPDQPLVDYPVQQGLALAATAVVSWSAAVGWWFMITTMV